jgi:hypothetical protein
VFLVDGSALRLTVIDASYPFLPGEDQSAAGEALAWRGWLRDNEIDVVSTGQGQVLFDHLTCPKEFRKFTLAEGAAGHCEGMAPIVFWTAALNWLDDLLAKA